MKRTREIGGKILKYAEGKLQDSSFSSEKIKKYSSDKIKKYAKNLTDVSKELMYASTLMAGHKKVVVESPPEL